jgi:hypothetical protein
MMMNFLDRVSKNIRISNFMKIHPGEAKLFEAGKQTDRQTDMTKLTIAFHNFSNAPNNNCVLNITGAIITAVYLTADVVVTYGARLYECHVCLMGPTTA